MYRDILEILQRSVTRPATCCDGKYRGRSGHRRLRIEPLEDRRLLSLTFSPPMALNTNAGSDIGSDADAKVTTDGLGNWVAVWTSDDNLGGAIGTDTDIFVSRSTDAGQTWTDPAALNTNAESDFGYDWNVQVTTDGLGNWVAVWRSSENLGGTIGTDDDILVSRSTDAGQTWTDPAALNTNAESDSGYDNYPQVTTDGLGNWVAVWHSDDNLGDVIGMDEDILVSRSTDNGQTWTDPAALNTNAESDSGYDNYPQVTTDGLGNWVAVWHSDDNLGGVLGTDNDILVSRSTDNGQTWTDPAALNTNAESDFGYDNNPQVTTDALGNWVAVWNSSENLGGAIGTDYDILFATFAITAVNVAPTLTSFASAVATVAEDTEVEIGLSDLKAQGNEADVDGTVDAFVIKAVSTGTLKIGADAGSATAWATGTNDTVDATRNAYWTPAADANGTLNAFTAVAEDNEGAESTPAVQAQVTVTPVNDPPTDITLSSSSVPENQASGTLVGTLNTTDPDAGDTFAYSLATGTGSTDNASFTISGNTLKTAASFDYEAKNAYSIRVRSTDQDGLYTEKEFTIVVTDVYETPTFVITAPTSGTYTAGQDVTIQWTANNVGSGSKINLCYDSDTTWWNGNETWIEIDQVAAANGNGSYNWNTTGVASGTYYVAGYLWSDSSPYFSHLAQPIAIQGNTTGPTVSSVTVVERTGVRDGTLTTSESLLMTFHVVDPDGVASATVHVDGQNVTPVYGPYAAASGVNFAAPLGTLFAGTHGYSIVATDNVGNPTSPAYTGTFNVTATVVAPIISNVVVAEAGTGSNHNGTPESSDKLVITWSATSADGIATRSLKVDGQAVAAVGGPDASDNCFGVFGPLAAGNHTYAIEATDTNGIASTHNGTFDVAAAAASAPQIGNVVVAETANLTRDGLLNSEETLVLTWTLTDADGIALKLLSIDGNVVATIYGPYGNAYAGMLGILSQGTHTYQIQAFDATGQTSTLFGTFQVYAALTLEASAAPVGSAKALTDTELAYFATEAIYRLEESLGSDVSTALSGISIEAADLPGNLLGASSDGKILIDSDAAGYGWFVDPTPTDDLEYVDPLAPHTLAARDDSPAAQRVDLLTAVMHEMGHVLGYEHSDSLDLMYPTLSLGTRKSLGGQAVCSMGTWESDGAWGKRLANTSAFDQIFASFFDSEKKEKNRL